MISLRWSPCVLFMEESVKVLKRIFRRQSQEIGFCTFALRNKCSVAFNEKWQRENPHYKTIHFPLPTRSSVVKQFGSK